ncbi:hypothetical protein [Streptomyces sp. NPDC005209]|uniref:hypothetical protein n=1 Tax=Streptomyces sp. NPDC005209 TaxID=3156715 RepID=UPI0033BB89BE
MGKKRALVAVMHKIVIATWRMLAIDTDYQGLGPSHGQQHPRQVKRRRQRLIAELSALGVGTSGLTPA